MKNKGIALLVFISVFCSGCTIDYDSYYKKYGDVSNKDSNLNSVKIEDGVTSYPLDNNELINKYSDIYKGVESEYSVYASYYSNNYDTLYISYDNIDTPVQTIDSRDLALIEEHLLNYFISDTSKSDYNNYLKVVRVYPDYASSTCRIESQSEDEYSKIEGCANYNALEASINLNSLTDIDRFFNSYTYNQDNVTYRVEPKRDTFAHEFGHVSTYYNMILKGDDTYESYLRLRLGEAYDQIYDTGLPDEYDQSDSYYTQPVEILADDYVELYYDTSEKKANDYYDYDLAYTDLRNSLSNVDGVSKFLKEDQELFDAIKEFYDLFINKNYIEYETPKVMNVTGISYNTIHDILNENSYIELSDANIVTLGELEINNNIYYRVVLSNIVSECNARSEYSSNIGYVLKDNAILTDKNVLHFTKYNGNELDLNMFLSIDEHTIILPHYDFSYFINENGKVKIYSYLDGVRLLEDLETYYK